jgi:Abnormal spindle-like microcephaly-assoc'd, ASPM-SPD-2-Hydin
MCGAADGACPPGCAAPMDVDCAGCGNGRLDTGETCDPVASCQAAFDACLDERDTVRIRTGDVGTCRFRCVPAPRTCGASDGFCPSMNCGPTRDADCAGCGNGRVEAGEVCDPPARCLDQQAACVSDTNFVRAGSGDPATCGFTCTATARMCGAADGACPMGCGPMQDRDCPGCGNGRVESPAETCDPVATCQEQSRACVSDNNVIRTPSGDPATCGFSCAEASRVCGAMDTFCPSGCSPVLDVDCAGCGNGRLEGTETCDPVAMCMAQSEACVSDANTLRVREGDPATCRFVCRPSSRMCGPADGECPTGCGPTMDVDCNGCGNSRLEMGEACDPVAACQERSVACESDENFIRTRTGSADACTFACPERPRECGLADGACPRGCLPTQDSDCAGCGNGRLEPGETCDPVAECTRQAAGCISDRDFIRMGAGDPAMCQFRCVEEPRPCVAGDGQCPSTCGPTSDSDCAGCGNGRIEMGETCDPCDSAVAMCVSDASTIRTPTGEAARCTFGCVSESRACVAGDGSCPMHCNLENDRDCRLPPGAACNMDGVCASDSCQDGVCCVEECSECAPCAAPDGRCVNAPRGTECNGSGNGRCDGAGECTSLQELGGTCQEDSSCISRHCWEGVCCATPCPGTCTSCSGQLAGTCEPRLTVSLRDIAFGRVAVGARASRTVTITNTCDRATEPLQFAGLASAFSVSFDTCTGTRLAPGSTCRFSVSFMPQAAGPSTGNVAIVGSQGGQIVLTVSGTGEAGPIMLIEPRFLELQRVHIGESRDLRYTVRNDGATESGLLNVVLRGPSTFSGVSDECQGRSLDPRTSCSTVVRYSPTNVSSGGGNATLEVSSTLGGGVAAQVSGVGLARRVLALETEDGTLLTSYDFLTLAISQNVRGVLRLWIRNLGLVATGMISTVVTSQDYSIAVPNTCHAPLMPGQRCELTILFHPTVVGLRNATLLVGGGSGVNSNLALRGIGSPRVQLTPSSVTRDFGVVAIGGSRGATVTFLNDGESPLNLDPPALAGSTTFTVRWTTCGGALDVLGTCSVDLVFAPTASGSETASLSVGAGVAGGREQAVVDLTGRGATPPECAAEASCTQCSSCSECAGQACVAGRCGACQTSADCCSPLLCLFGQCGLF